MKPEGGEQVAKEQQPPYHCKARNIISGQKRPSKKRRKKTELKKKGIYEPPLS
jgi:hypothetical protein